MLGHASNRQMEGTMTFSKPWIGQKRVAFVPLFRTNAAPPDQIPANWENAILSRVMYDPRPAANGADRSLRAWLRAVSSGRAEIDPVVLPMQTIDKQVVEADELEGTLGNRLRDQGTDAAMLVMLGGRGAATNRGFWSRVVMAESTGVWLMELIHGLTGFKDLYHFNNDVDPPERSIDSFDEMSASSQTHPTAFTKNELGWLDTATIPLHRGASTLYDLQHISLAQPPVAGRAAALRIGDSFPYVMVEARKMTDQFEAGMPSTNDGQEKGIQSEGVIAYRVQTRNPTVQEREGRKKPLYLMTTTPLKPGQSAAVDNAVVTVTSEIPGGFAIRIEVPVPWTSVSEGSTTPGGMVTAVLWGKRIALFLADPNGGVYTTGGDPQGGFGPWARVSEGNTTPGGMVTAVPWGQRIALFLADPNGGVYTTGGGPQGGFGPWTSVSEGGTTPGGTISAVITSQNRIALFLADRNGGIYTTSGSAEAGWGPWRNVSEGQSTPGAPVTAVVIHQNRVDLFIADPNGGVYTTAGNYEGGWQPWTSVWEGRTTPGGHIAAALTRLDRVGLFLADPVGGVYTSAKLL